MESRDLRVEFIYRNLRGIDLMRVNRIQKLQEEL